MQVKNVSMGNTKDDTSKYLFFADTPIQVANCVSLALGGVQSDALEEHHLFIYGNFSNASEIRDFALSSGAFQEVHLYDSELLPTKSLSRVQTYGVLLGLYFGKKFIKDFPDFICSTSYSAMFISCSTIVTYDLFLRLKNTNPDLCVYLYEDGTGTYTGNVFRGLAFPGSSPKCINNRLIVRFVKALLPYISRNYQPYPVRRLYVKQPSLLQGDFGMEVFEFSFDKCVVECTTLSPSRLVSLLADCDNIFLETPEEDGSYEISVEAEFALLKHGIGFALRMHPRTLTKRHELKTVPDCTGGLWESLCSHMDRESSTMIGFCSSSMLAPAAEYGFYPRIVLLDNLYIARQCKSESRDACVQMLNTLYRGHEDLILLPHSINELVDALSAKGAPHAQNAAIENVPNAKE